jgi:NADH-quinone oxidoreductase subunit M
MLIIPIISLFLIFATGERKSRKIIIISTLLNLLLTLGIFVSAIISKGINITEQYQYITALGISLAFRINPIVLALLIMSSVVLFVAALSGNPEKEGIKLSSALLALFQIGAIGLFTSSNLIIFFVFWDIGVIAMFLMINILGSANRKAASMNFLLYEILASSLLLLAIILIYFYTPVHSFDIAYITANSALIPVNIRLIIFGLFFVAFMINMPLFPTHFWLPDAHTEASTQGSMVLSGILTKFGGFGMIILFAMLPISRSYSLWIAGLAIFSTIYAAFLLMRQRDLKKIIAYSTIIEMGIIMIGITAGNSFGTYGAAYAMLSHGLAVALAFLLVGVIKYAFGERSIEILKGTVANAKFTTYAFLFGIFAMIGFPLTAGFIGDLLLFIGSFQTFGILGLAPIVGIVLMGAYLYYVVNKSMLSTKDASKLVNLVGIEQKIGYCILIFFILIYGFLPFAILNLVKL